MIAANSASSSSYEVRIRPLIDGVDGADVPAHVDAVAVGQPGVEDRHVGPQRRDAAGRLLRRARLADHLDVAAAAAAGRPGHGGRPRGRRAGTPGSSPVSTRLAPPTRTGRRSRRDRGPPGQGVPGQSGTSGPARAPSRSTHRGGGPTRGGRNCHGKEHHHGHRLHRRAARAAAADAVRAPSLHNTQPWRFRLRDGGIEVPVDPDRRLPATDPSGWGARIACGAALFNLRLVPGRGRHPGEGAAAPVPGRDRTCWPG